MTEPVLEYRVVTTTAAARDIAGLKKRPPSGDIVNRVDEVIRDLAKNPRPSGSIELTNQDKLLRITVGDYRVLYSVVDEARIVRIARVRH